MALDWFVKISAVMMVLLVSIDSHVFSPSEDHGCERVLPEGAQGVKKIPGDNGFTVIISGHPTKYVPGEAYTITLKNVKLTEESSLRFTGFALSVESTVPGQTGVFELTDPSNVEFVPGCATVITHTSLNPKLEIHVRWRAPSTGSGCVKFKAQVVELKSYWYQDDGALTKELCKEDFERPSSDHTCNACAEAKYEVIFEGLWSRHTHPKDFPKADTSFSDIVGASHSNMYSMWSRGEYATDGLQNLAVNGDIFLLESELVNNSKLIRTMIKARGLKHATSKTFAVFRMDQKHHLLSIVSKIIPSPDWFVGVDGLELCLSEGRWADQLVYNLYPWDAGVDDAVSYNTKEPLPRKERDLIRRITPSFPNNPESPFFDESGREIQPLAKLIITKKRQYEMPCQDDLSDEDIGGDCETTEWSSYSPCSVSCGSGYHIRSREYVIPPLRTDCNKMLIQRKDCKIYCSGNDFSKPRPTRCVTSSWSTWSECSASCGPGVRQRSRDFLDKSIEKYCTATKIISEQCVGRSTACKSHSLFNRTCETTQWSLWSPCSTTCGKGSKSRTRVYLNSEDKYRCQAQTTEIEPCLAKVQDCTINPEDAKRICVLDRVVGPCRGYFPRWYFNPNSNSCSNFIYSGCRGNENNFDSFEECNYTCYHVKNEGKPPTSSRSIPDGSVDCMVSEWGHWSACSETCGKGFFERRRNIKVFPRNGGKECPKKLAQRKRCALRPCHG